MTLQAERAFFAIPKRMGYFSKEKKIHSFDDFDAIEEKAGTEKESLLRKKLGPYLNDHRV